MKPEEIVVGGVYEGASPKYPRKVIRKGFYWTSKYHELVYYIGRSGKEIEMEARDFARWAVRRVDSPETGHMKEKP